MEAIKYLPEAEQTIALIYIMSGVFFLVFTYLILYCEFILKTIRFSIGILMFAIGFMFLSTAGNIIKGQEYSLKILTQWSVIICTLTAAWVVVELLKWNHTKRKEALNKNENEKNTKISKGKQPAG